MRNIAQCFIFLMFIAAPCSVAYAIDDLGKYFKDPEVVGQGRLTYMFWDVYDATLYAPQGTWQEDDSFALKLSYRIKIDGVKIADRSVQEMRKQGFSNELKLAAWHGQMRKIFPDVSRGTRLTGIVNDQGETVFYHDNKGVGRITDPEFARAFFGIWLHEHTTRPKLRRQLLGQL